MSSIGPDFGVTKETRGQQTPMTPRTNTTLQTLGPATGEEVLPAHEAVRGQVLTPPRLEQSWVSIYIKMRSLGPQSLRRHGPRHSNSRLFAEKISRAFGPVASAAPGQ
jgi:hypothetical protein